MMSSKIGLSMERSVAVSMKTLQKGKRVPKYFFDWFFSLLLISLGKPENFKIALTRKKKVKSFNKYYPAGEIPFEVTSSSSEYNFWQQIRL